MRVNMWQTRTNSLCILCCALATVAMNIPMCKIINNTYSAIAFKFIHMSVYLSDSVLKLACVCVCVCALSICVYTVLIQLSVSIRQPTDKKKITIHAYEYKHFRRGGKVKISCSQTSFSRSSIYFRFVYFCQFANYSVILEAMQIPTAHKYKLCNGSDIVKIKFEIRSISSLCAVHVIRDTYTLKHTHAHKHTNTHVLRSKYTANRISAIMLNVHLTAHMPPKI